MMKTLYEPEPIVVKLEMSVFARKGDWVIVQYFTDPYTGEAFIYNTKEDKCYGGYSSVEDDELSDDWYKLTGENSDEE